jgi:hypothetical protein
LIKQADPDAIEEWKWDVPVWSHDGLICTGESYKQIVKPHVRERSVARRSVAPFQLEPRREHAARDRLSRR